MFLSGQVIMDDGSPVPHNVQIERYCGGQAIKEGHTDSRGFFSFQVGRNLELLQDASVSMPFSARNGLGSSDATSPYDMAQGNLPVINGEMSLTGCELRASLAGYRSSRVDLTTHRSLDNPDVGVIVLQSMSKVAGTTMSVTAYKAPKDAKKAYENGMQALKKHEDDKARQELEKAVKIYPGHAEAWAELGYMRRRLGDVKGAAEAFQESMKADQRFVTPYMGMAELSSDTSNWPDVAHYSQQALDLDPLDYPGAHFLNAIANYNLKKYDAAENSAKHAQRLDPQHHFARLDLLMGSIFIARQNYGEALNSMRSYLKYSPNADDAAQVKQKIAELEPLAQQRKP